MYRTHASGRRLSAYICGISFGLVLLASCHSIDYNPVIEPASIVGRWRLGGLVVQIEKDGTFEMIGRPKGRWTLRDWNLELDFGSEAVEYWRVVTVDGRPALIRNWRDMDLSANDPTFKKE